MRDTKSKVGRPVRADNDLSSLTPEQRADRTRKQAAESMARTRQKRRELKEQNITESEFECLLKGHVAHWRSAPAS
jgi:hypothetical protein